MVDLIILAEVAATMWDLLCGTRGASLLGVVIGLGLGIALFVPG